MQTDDHGRFRFSSVKLGEYVLTVEADGCAPQHRHIKVEPKPTPHEFRLKAGRKISNQVVDNAGNPVRGACVVLDDWHTHTDPKGFFHWSMEAPLPERVKTKIYKRYTRQYETLETTMTLARIEREAITLKLSN